MNKYYQLFVGKVYWDNSNICPVETFMPSTRRQKAKARKSRELGMMSDIDNLDIMLENSGENPIKRELADAIEQSSVQGDYEANEYRGNNYSFTQENEPLRQNEVRQSFETFTNEFNLRLSQERDSMMSMVHNQMNRAISTAISERVIPEIQNIVSSMSVTAACPYPALRLDKLYAALIRCLVLWTVTKQFLVFLFKGLYLLAGGSDVTRGISCDSSFH